MSLFGRTYEDLADGSVIVLRPLERYDAALVRRVFLGMSEASRASRFMSHGASLSPGELERLVDVDHRDHEAVIAQDVWTRAPVGVAHYFRTAPNSKVAEVAMAVVDDWQGRGVGRALVRQLARRAQRGSIERFDAWALAGNRPALALLSELGPTERTWQGDAVQLDIELADEPEATFGPGALARWSAIACWEPTLIWADAARRALEPRAAPHGTATSQDGGAR